MTTQTHPKTYTCPKCGRVHTADLSAMEGRPEIHGKVHCIQCHELLWLSLAEDGSTVVEIYERHLHDVKAASPASTDKPAPGTAVPGAPAKRGTGIAPLLVAALVAAIVSFLVGQATGADQSEVRGSAATGAGGADEPAADEIDALRADLDELRSSASAVAAAHEGLQARIQDAAKTQVEALSGLQSDLAGIRTTLEEIRTRLAKVEESYDSLHGRIEMNYTNLRAAKKRLDALDGE